MEKERVKSVDFLSDVVKNGVEAGIKIATRQYHLITDLQQLLMEKEKMFRMLGEQVFQMIDQGRIFAPAIMQATFKIAKEIVERIAHLEENTKNEKEGSVQEFVNPKDKSSQSHSKKRGRARSSHAKREKTNRKLKRERSPKNRSASIRAKKIGMVSKKKGKK